MDHSPLAEINALIEQSGDNTDRFAETLRRRRIPHLSFSQVSTVESCPRRYYLEYILLVEPRPTPLYFTKGKLLHEMIASIHRKNARGEALRVEEYQGLIERELQDEHRSHLQNALRIHLEHLRKDARVVAVEKPFVMEVDPRLPPLVGVIDLVLEQDGALLLIDHKTGRDFYPEDELQAAIYSETMRRQFGGAECAFYYEHYRWVNHLERIRKPAFQRRRVDLPAGYWQSALRRIRSAYRVIEQIQQSQRAPRTGECFRCPHQGACRDD